jgi:hypothetical protein
MQGRDAINKFRQWAILNDATSVGIGEYGLFCDILYREVEDEDEDVL